MFVLWHSVPKSHYVENIRCENASVWTRPLNIVLGLLSELKVSLDVIQSFFFGGGGGGENLPEKRFFLEKFTQVGSLYNLLNVWKRNERDLHQLRPNFIFIVKKCTYVHL